MPTNVNTLSIEITANAGGVEKAAKKAGQAIAGLKDAEINVSADTAEAQKKLKDAQAQADSLDGGEIPVDADTTVAQQKLKDAQEQAEGLADGKYSVHVDADTGDAESAIEGLKSKITGVLAGIGAGAIVKQILEFGVESIGLASDYEQTLGKARQMLDETSFNSVQAYTEGKYEKYGLNRTGILDMTTNFAGAYKSMGIESEQAAQYAERMADAAIDYASVLNKTPAEVGEIMMSLMRGNTAVADNISLYGLTADKMMARAKELKEKGLIPEGMDEASAKYVALLNIIEENSDTLGFTGDWDRTYEQYANQTTLLAEQWQTLKTNVGTLLGPAATDIVKFFNQILTGMNEFTEGAKAHSFTDDVNGYFGTMEIKEADLQPIMDNIINPMDEVTESVNTAQLKLSEANGAYKNAYDELMKTLQIIEAGGELNEDQIGEEMNALRDAAGNNIDAQATDFITTLESFMGTPDAWTEAQKQALDQIDAYFNALKKEAATKADELAKIIYESVHDDGTITADEYARIREKSKELNNATLDTASGRAKATAEAALAGADAGGYLSAESVKTAYDTVMGSLEDSFKGYDETFMDYKADIYAFESQQQRDKATLSDEEYKEKYGSLEVIDADALVESGRAEYDETKATAAGNAAIALADLIGPSLVHAFEGIGEVNGDYELWEKFGAQIQEIQKMGDLAGALQELADNGQLKEGSNAQAFLNLFNLLSGAEKPVTLNNDGSTNMMMIWALASEIGASSLLETTHYGNDTLTGLAAILGIDIAAIDEQKAITEKDYFEDVRAVIEEESATALSDQQTIEALKASSDATVSAVDSGNDAIVNAVDNATRMISSVADRPYIIRIYQSPYSAGSYRRKENAAYSKVLGR